MTGDRLLPPLKAICRREVHRGRLAVNPTAGLELPAIRGGRTRIADPTEAAALLAVLPEGDRAIWATAMYAGLRRGELMALRVDRIDMDANVIHVKRGWDMIEGEIETKGRNRRRVPIASVLREHLLSHLMRSGRRGDQLVFGVTERSPLSRGGSRSAQTRRGRRLSSTGSSCMSAATLSPQSGIAGMYNI